VRASPLVCSVTYIAFLALFSTQSVLGAPFGTVAKATAPPVSSFSPLISPTPQVGAPILVDDLVAQAREYDDKPVAATGTAQNVRTDSTPRGPVLQYDLCGHQCIHVLDATNPSVSDGATLTVKGPFHQHFSLGRFSASDIIIIAPDGLPTDHTQDWRRNLEQGPWATPAP
jgi:hypothetical protein